jgi:hypothetical protein
MAYHMNKFQFFMQRNCATVFGECLPYWFKTYLSSVSFTNTKNTARVGQTKRRDLHIRHSFFHFVKNVTDCIHNFNRKI